MYFCAKYAVPREQRPGAACGLPHFLTQNISCLMKFTDKIRRALSAVLLPFKDYGAFAVFMYVLGLVAVYAVVPAKRGYHAYALAPEELLVDVCLLSLLLITVALSLGLLISCVVGNQVAAMLVSGMGLMMPVMLLSGMIFPVESMPLVLQWISDIIPARWYIQAVRKVMIEGLGFGAVWREVRVLSGMAMLLVALSLKKFKVRLE